MALSMPGYCTFTATRSPAARRRAMNLADARGRERLGLPLREDLGRMGAELLRDDFDGRLGRERRGLGLELLQRLFEALLVAGWSEPIDVRRHLAELEREPLHVAEGLQHRLGGLARALEDLAPLVFRGVHLACAHRALHGGGRERERPRRERAEPSEPSEPRRRRLVVPRPIAG